LGFSNLDLRCSSSDFHLKAYWLAIGDSIIVQIRDSELKEVNKNQSLEVEAYYPNPDEETLNLLRTFRNNKDAKYSYAALTGEEVAMNFIQQGEFLIEKGDIIFIYTDGLQSFFDRFKAGQEHLSLDEIKNISTQYCLELKQKLDDQTIIKLEF
jgi:serine/threonine protein phosphatase PrpC